MLPEFRRRHDLRRSHERLRGEERRVVRESSPRESVPSRGDRVTGRDLTPRPTIGGVPTCGRQPFPARRSYTCCTSRFAFENPSGASDLHWETCRSHGRLRCGCGCCSRRTAGICRERTTRVPAASPDRSRKNHPAALRVRGAWLVPSRDEHTIIVIRDEVRGDRKKRPAEDRRSLKRFTHAAALRRSSRTGLQATDEMVVDLEPAVALAVHVPMEPHHVHDGVGWPVRSWPSASASFVAPS